MKFFVVLAVTLACVAADVSHLLNENAQVLRQDSDVSPVGFQYSFETSNGIYGDATAVLKNPNSENPALSVQGNYKYTSNEGTPVEFSYTADENGYNPVSSSIPVAPEIPPLIARALQYIADHPPSATESAAQRTYG